jgi:hypothetical protein
MSTASLIPKHLTLDFFFLGVVERLEEEMSKVSLIPEKIDTSTRPEAIQQNYSAAIDDVMQGHVSIGNGVSAARGLLRRPSYPHVCSRMLMYAHVCSRMLTYAHVCLGMQSREGGLRRRRWERRRRFIKSIKFFALIRQPSLAGCLCGKVK